MTKILKIMEIIKNSIDELLEGILKYSRTEDIIANGDKIVKLLTILEPRIKRKSLINKLYTYIDFCGQYVLF